MATQVTTTHPTKRGDFLYIHPDDVIIDPKLRGRHKAPDKDAIESLAASILEHGQQQAVQARRLPDKRLQLVYGYTRHAAVKLLHEQGHTEIMLKVTVTTCNEEEAFVANVVENKHRNATTPIDDAHNQRRLREQHGKSDDEIAKLYRCSKATISQYAKLLNLPTEIQRKVHEGQLATSAALLLVDVSDPQEQARLVDESSDDSGRVKGAQLRELLRQSVEDREEETQAGKGEAQGQSQTPTNSTKPPRTLKNVRDFFTDLSTPEDETEAVVNFAKVMLDWVNGKKSDKQLYNAIKKMEE